jgi:hypothetical protein
VSDDYETNEERDQRVHEEYYEELDKRMEEELKDPS